VDYSSPGTVAERARLFARLSAAADAAPRPAAKAVRPPAAAAATSGMAAFASSLHACPKCADVIFKPEEVRFPALFGIRTFCFSSLFCFVMGCVVQVVAAGAVWHKHCITCGEGGAVYGCRRTLTLDSYAQYGGWPFCTACYLKNFAQVRASSMRER